MVSARQQGFTLIELMTGLAISAVLAVLSVPLTVSWVSGARQLQARGDLVNAVGQAKSIALRNGTLVAGKAIENGVAVSRLRFAANRLQVEDAADGSVRWSADLHPSVALEVLTASGTEPLSCIAFGNRGMAVSGDVGCSQESSRLVLQVAGQEDLDVELL